MVTTIQRCSMIEKTAITKAIELGQEETVKTLLTAGAQVNQLSLHKDYTEPAIVTAVRYKLESVVKILLLHSADVNLAGDRGHTALIIAAQKDLIGTVKLLLENGANPNAVDCSRLCALFWAIKRKNEGMVAELLKSGASPNISILRKTSLVHTAASCGCTAVAGLLLDSGARVNDVDGSLETPLFNAIRGNDFGMTELLLEHGAVINAVNHDLRTPLHIASASVYNGVDLSQLLLDNGAAVNVIDRYGNTPLALSLNNNIVWPNHAVSKCLIQHGSIMNEENVIQALEWVVIMHDGYEIFKLAVRAGLRIHNIDWVKEMVDGTGRLQRGELQFGTRQKKMEFVNYIKDELLRHAQSLAFITRIVVRNHLIAVSQGQSIYQKIQKLPLPMILKMFLSFEE